MPRSVLSGTESKENDMRILTAAALSAIVMTASPILAHAQAPQPDRVAAHACMKQHLGGLHVELREHMRQFRAAHPGADRPALKAERHAFGHALRQSNRDAILAARNACGIMRR